ncbi:MAG TPA: hypothetical protein VH639_01665 [Bryobacteraceae bacterium]|jgi:hypothetical protein
MHHAKDKRILVFDAVHNHIFAHGQAAISQPEIFVARAPDIRKAGKGKETVGDGISQTVGNLDAAAFLGHVQPDVVKIAFCV